MIAAHLSGITNVKKFFIVIINFMHNLGQYNLVRLVVMYAFTRNCSFPICLHMHPKSFDAGLRQPNENAALNVKSDTLHNTGYISQDLGS